MAALWPAAFDTPADAHRNAVGESVNADDINLLADIVKALEQILGLNPHQGNIPAGVYPTIVARLNAIDTPTIKVVTPPYTPIIGDIGTILNCFNTVSANVTLPPNSAVPYPLGSTLTFRAGQAGAITIVGGTGVVVNSRGGAITSAGQFAMISALKTNTDSWNLMGDLV